MDISIDSPSSVLPGPHGGMVKALKPDAVYIVEETLWEGQKCRVKVDNSGH
jgi:hypothetical protein